MKSEQEIRDKLSHYYKVREDHQDSTSISGSDSDTSAEIRRDFNYITGLIHALEWALGYEEEIDESSF